MKITTNNGGIYEFNKRNIIYVFKGLSQRGRLLRIYTVDGKMVQFETGVHNSDISDEVYDNFNLGE